MPETATISGAILMGLTLIAAAIRWSVGRLAKSQDRAITALIKNAETHAAMTSKFDDLTSRFESLAARFDRIVDTLLGNVQVADMTDSQRVKFSTRSTGSQRRLDGDTIRDGRDRDP